MKLELLEEVDSTNLYARRYLETGESVVVCARRQTGGRGTKGRSFLSGEGGVYLTRVFFPENFPADRLFLATENAAVAVCKTAEDYGLSPRIKWPNDVLIGGKKLAGILIENVVRGSFLYASLIGIGLNVSNDLTALGGIAVSLNEATGRKLDVEEVRDKLIFHLDMFDHTAEYRERAAFLGKEIMVTEGTRRYSARALDVLPDGRLQIETEDGMRALSAAEIGIRVD